MLLQFAVENFRSYHGEQILNMVPAKSKIHPDHILNARDKGKKVRALPVAILYGANASGKSNLTKALGFAKGLIVHGTRGESKITVTPFRLDPSSAIAPSRFEFVLKHEGVLYTYGFLVTSKEVKEEWLFATYRAKEVPLFERITKADKTVVEFGGDLATAEEGEPLLKFVAQGTRPNQLFLTEANERNVQQLNPLWRWFHDRLIVLGADIVYPPLAARAHQDKAFAEFMGELLEIADTGIQGLETKVEPFDASRFLPSMPDEIRADILQRIQQFRGKATLQIEGISLVSEENEQAQLFTLLTEHKTVDGMRTSFNLDAESDGTKRLMHLAPALLDLQSDGKVYVIDELDRSLHPHLSRLFVDTFLQNAKSGGCCGQMIVTTHDTSLLDLSLLRRDEIWFVEKDDQDASRLTSLAEFKGEVRADLKVAKSYLNGRFGAVPIIRDTRRLFRKKRAHP